MFLALTYYLNIKACQECSVLLTINILELVKSQTSTLHVPVIDKSISKPYEQLSKSWNQ